MAYRNIFILFFILNSSFLFSQSAPLNYYYQPYLRKPYQEDYLNKKNQLGLLMASNLNTVGVNWSKGIVGGSFYRKSDTYRGNYFLAKLIRSFNFSLNVDGNIFFQFAGNDKPDTKNPTASSPSLLTDYRVSPFLNSNLNVRVDFKLLYPLCFYAQGGYGGNAEVVSNYYYIKQYSFDKNAIVYNAYKKNEYTGSLSPSFSCGAYFAFNKKFDIDRGIYYSLHLFPINNNASQLLVHSIGIVYKLKH